MSAGRPPPAHPAASVVVGEIGEVAFVREIEDVHEGTTLRVNEWELRLAAR